MNRHFIWKKDNSTQGTAFAVTAVLAAVMLMTTGCGAETSTEAQPESPAAETGSSETSETAGQTTTADTGESSLDSYESPDAADALNDYGNPYNLPKYVYTGDEPYLDVISEYMVTTYAEEGFGTEADVYIPYSFISGTDESNPEDILVYGEYDIDGYELKNTTLVSINGARNRGVFHLKKESDGAYTVVSADLPPTEMESVELFSDTDGLYEKLSALTEEEIEAKRTDAIAGYIKANSALNITQWQDYGWEPEAIPGTATSEEAQFYTLSSDKGYSITYDLRAYSMSESSDSDMLGKVEEDYTGTFMLIRKSAKNDADEAINEVLAEMGAAASEITDAAIGNGLVARRTAWDENLDDGRIFRYICYAVPSDNSVLLVMLETTYEPGVNEMSLDDLDASFKPTLDTLRLD